LRFGVDFDAGFEAGFDAGFAELGDFAFEADAVVDDFVVEGFVLARVVGRRAVGAGAFFGFAPIPGTTDFPLSTTVPATSAAPPATPTIVLATLLTPFPTFFSKLPGCMRIPSPPVNS
jgi:hypothetical protein